jgi:uncharacterized repeat protein (TIGR04052 family)
MILALLLACGSHKHPSSETGGEGEQTFSIPFRARIGAEDFSCGTPLSGLGLHANTVKVNDLRFYIHGVELLEAGGAAVPLVLEQDGIWQLDDLALMDFEDGTGDCETGSPAVHTTLTGSAPAGDYLGLRFQLGVPDALNHIDIATAAPPLNDPNLYWSWTGGYKFLKIDLITPAETTYFFHLGATDCEMLDDGSYDCSADNVGSITLDGVDPGNSSVVLDLAKLYAESDLSGATMEGDMMPGCMSSEGDPECPALFEALGLPWAEVTEPEEQVVFSVEAR